MTKPSRQKVVLELAGVPAITSQEQLQRALAKRGFKVGQATLSRDLRELRLVKTPQGYGMSMEASTEPSLPPVSRLVREFVVDVRVAQNLLVIKTTVGSAQPVAAALDYGKWPEEIGSVAGDDTILIVCADKKSATKLAGRIQELLA